MDLEQEIIKIQQRNQKVESDKAWEISWMRRISVATLTYLVITLFFYILNLPKPFINALVPMIGFILSTLTISLFKMFWLKYIYKK